MGYVIPGLSTSSGQAPSDILLSANSILEDAAQGTAIGSITVIDPDDDSWLFSITDNSKFQLSPAEGEFAALQRSGTGTLTFGQNEVLTIQVTDPSGRTFSKQFTILVEDAIENIAPTAVDQSFSVAPTAVNDALVAIVALTNAPFPAEITPTFTSGNSAGIFRIVYEPGQVAIYVDDNTNLPAADNTTINLGVRLSNGINPDADIVVSVAVSATAGLLLSVVTITEAAATAKTNEIVEFGFPIAPAAMGIYTGFAVYDDDGSGGRGSPLANFQADNRSTDGAGYARWVQLTGIVPSLASGGTRKLRVYAETGSEPTGTSITVADILATTAAADGLVVCTFDFAGTEYTADLAEILTSGSGTFSKTGLWLSADKWRDGPVCTEFVCRAAPRNAGAPHVSGDGVHVEFHVAAYKAGAGAVTGGNPITLIRVDAVLENADLMRVSPSHYHYGLLVQRATSMSDGTLISTDDTNVMTGETIRYSHPRSTPAADLTLSSAATGSRTITRSAGVWAADIKGASILSGAGVAYVTARLSDTQITAYVYVAFSSTSIASGAWSIEGVFHKDNWTDRKRVWIGSKPTNVVAWGDNTSAVTPTSRAHLDYIAASKLVFNFQVPLASVTHTGTPMTRLDLMRADGQYRPFTVLGPSGTYFGEINTNLGVSGGGGYIGVFPQWSVLGLARYDQNGRRRIFENARYWATWNHAFCKRLSGTPSAGSLPCPPRGDNGTYFARNSAFSGETLVRAVTPNVCWDNDTSHQPEPFLVPLALTGDLFWLQRLQATEAYTAWGQFNAGNNGSGMNRTPYGDALGLASDAFGLSTPRAMAWAMRDQLHTTIMTPDDDRDTLFNAKSHYTARVAKAWQAQKFYGPDDVTGQYDGEIVWVDEANRGNLANYKPYVDTPWMLYFQLEVQGHAAELNLNDANHQAYWEWLAPLVTEVYLDPNVVPDIMSSCYRNFIRDDDEIVDRLLTWADVYRYGALNGPRSPSELTSHYRVATGTLTLSDNKVGTGRTATFSNSYFTDPFHVGGYITELVAANTVCAAVFKITAVNSATQVTGDILNFGPGTLNVTNGSPIVTISGATFNNNYLGLKLDIGGTLYTVSTRESSTQVTLSTNYAGATATGVEYGIAFSSTTPTISRIYLPQASPTDYAGEKATPLFDYGQGFKMAACLMEDAGIAGAAAARTYMLGRTGYYEYNDYWWIDRRT